MEPQPTAAESTQIRISVIIISHGHDEMLHACLASLVPVLDGIDAELLIVDNLPDGAAERLLRPSFPAAMFCRNSFPVGLAENMNRAAERTSGRYLLFLNPDTEYHSGSIADALDYLAARPDMAILGCRLLNPDGSEQPNYRRFPTLPVFIGRALGMDRWPRCPRYYRQRMMRDVVLDRPTPVDWVFGAFMLIGRAHYRAVGGMDSGFHLYYEDVDLCYRARMLGFRTIFYPALRFTHRHMRSSVTRPFGQAWRWHLHSAMRFLGKHRFAFHPPVDDAAS